MSAPTGHTSIREYLGLNRSVAVLAVSIFGLGLGEELWQAFLPKYLVALGASSVAVGAFASCKDLLDSLYQIPGGWISDRFGSARALTLFTVLATAGYLVYAVSVHWIVPFAGLGLVMAWKSGAFPATFALIGESLPKERRVIAFSVQSILVRLPRVIGAPIGGLLIASLGVIAGVRTALIVTMIVAAGVVLAQRHGFRGRKASSPLFEPAHAAQIFGAMPAGLKRLLLADCLVRIGEGIAAVFIVLYVTGVQGFSAYQFGILYAVQQTVSILLYLPVGRLAEITGRKPLIVLTFCFFALFPLAVRLSTTFAALLCAFVIGGLKEMGEPARKSLIVDLAPPAHRGRSVGVYYSIRNLLVVPAGVIGGLLWRQNPALPLQVACVVGLAGVGFYAVAGSKSEK